MSAGVTHGKVVINIAGELRNFVRPRQLGSLMGSDTASCWNATPTQCENPT